MAKIGIYKIGKPIYFKENEDDHASWSIEVTKIAHLLADRGHEVYLLSENDYVGNKFKKRVHGQLDKIYVWNGPLDQKDWEEVFFMSNDVRLIVTDMALIPQDTSRFTHVYTQSNELHEYARIQENVLYKAKFVNNQKSILWYFGGTERNRSQDFFEYVLRPDHLWHGKSDTLGIRNYVPYHEHVELMRKSKYTIVIGDKNYTKIGFVTPRYYECLINGMLPFVDIKYDKNNLVHIHPFLKVDGYVEMYKKIQLLEASPGERDKVLKEAIDLIPEAVFTGDNVYNAII